jgi:CcmD family protein
MPNVAYVVAAYVVTWVVILGYTVYLSRATARARRVAAAVARGEHPT